MERGLMVMRLESCKQRAGRQTRLPKVVVESTLKALLANGILSLKRVLFFKKDNKCLLRFLKFQLTEEPGPHLAKSALST